MFYFLFFTRCFAQNLNTDVMLYFQDVPDSVSPYGIASKLVSRNLELKNKEQELFFALGFVQINKPDEIDESWSEFLLGFYVNSYDTSPSIEFPLGCVYFYESLKPRANAYYSGTIQGLISERKISYASLDFMFTPLEIRRVSHLKFLMGFEKPEFFYGANIEILNAHNFKFHIGPKCEFLIPLKNKIFLKLGSSLFYEISEAKDSFLIKLNLSLGSRNSFIF